jgi:hypothetical protein
MAERMRKLMHSDAAQIERRCDEDTHQRLQADLSLQAEIGYQAASADVRTFSHTKCRFAKVKSHANLSIYYVY